MIGGMQLRGLSISPPASSTSSFPRRASQRGWRLVTGCLGRYGTAWDLRSSFDGARISSRKLPHFRANAGGSSSMVEVSALPLLKAKLITESRVSVELVDLLGLRTGWSAPASSTTGAGEAFTSTSAFAGASTFGSWSSPLRRASSPSELLSCAGLFVSGPSVCGEGESPTSAGCFSCTTGPLMESELRAFSMGVEGSGARPSSLPEGVSLLPMPLLLDKSAKLLRMFETARFLRPFAATGRKDEPRRGFSSPLSSAANDDSRVSPNMLGDTKKRLYSAKKRGETEKLLFLCEEIAHGNLDALVKSMRRRGRTDYATCLQLEFVGRNCGIVPNEYRRPPTSPDTCSTLL